MRNLIIEPTPKTPKIVFDVNAYTFEITGRSIPEDSVAFYRKVYSWLDQFGSELTGTVNFEFGLEYFNTSSSKCILDIFKRLMELNKKNPGIGVVWYYEEGDDDMQDTGEDYKELLDLPFEVKERA